ncbi:MAG TPA: hypothetical protein VNW97_00445 [Candidatus Saccharimonadales bacterium]|jgi:hypothetical protein|nr:hypothetical protein [Candidatus Saccharimonadales bacterium]
MGTRTQPLAVIGEHLQTYAQRGVFRSFSQTSADGRKAEYRFYWLWNLPFHLSFDSQRKTLTFKKLLPGVLAGSDLNAQLRAFIQDRCSSSQPEHRWVDPKRVLIRYSNRRGDVSISFLVVKNDYAYGVTKALNLINEIFVGFLNVYFPEYMVQHFHRPED